MFNKLSVYVQPEHELRNMHEVLALISRHPKGLLMKKVKDAYKGVGDDVKVRLAAMLQFYARHCLCYLPAHQRHRTGSSVCSAVPVTATHQFCLRCCFYGDNSSGVNLPKSNARPLCYMVITCPKIVLDLYAIWHQHIG